MKKGLCLISGGIDSAVAGKIVRDKGYPFDAIHFSIEPFTDSSPEEKSRILSKKIGAERFFVIHCGKAFSEFVKNCRHKYYFVLSKRLMIRIACRIAAKEGLDFIITGEDLGQVSSQTLSNLYSISKVSTLPIIRPLLCYDKQEIIYLAKKFDTYNISCGPEVCDRLGPKNPATSCQEKFILDEEMKIDIERILIEEIDNAACESLC